MRRLTLNQEPRGVMSQLELELELELDLELEPVVEVREILEIRAW